MRLICLRKAKTTRNDAEKLTWLMLAKGWLLLLDFQDAVEQKLHAAKAPSTHHNMTMARRSTSGTDHNSPRK
jgi:hypothetical protein